MWIDMFWTLNNNIRYNGGQTLLESCFLYVKSEFKANIIEESVSLRACQINTDKK